MNRHDLDPRRALPSESAGEMEGPGGQAEAGGGRTSALAPVLRHWLMVLLVWVIGSAIAVPVVWKLKTPVYTATGQIKVDPILSNPLERQMQTIPLFEGFLSSQAVLLGSRDVLKDALEDPKVRALADENRPRSVSELRSGLEILPTARTQIIQVAFSHNDAGTAIVVADAILDAFLDRYGGNKDLDRQMEFLTARESELRSQIDLKEQEKLKLASEHQAVTDSMFEVLRQRDLKKNEQTMQQLEAADLEILRLQMSIDQIKAGKYSPTIEAEASLGQDPLEESAVAKSLQEQIGSESSRLYKYKDIWPASEIKKAEERIDKLKKELEKERMETARNRERDRQAMQERLKSTHLATLQGKLEYQKNLRSQLAAIIEKQEANDKRMGEISIKIQALDLDITKLKKELDQVEVARKRVEMEKLQPGPGRVSKASAAEILPDGHMDKRPKLVLVAVMGSLFFGIALAIVRGRLDSRVRAPGQVAAGTGLHILGAVPAINDLKKGRITEEEFAESYRILRVNILSRAWGEPPRSILITSAQAREGKTSLALSLSVSLAETGKRVLLIDADLQAPKIGNLLGIDAPSKLQSVLSGVRDLASSTAASRLTNVDVLLGGPYADGRLVEQQSADKLIREASAQYDYVVVDSSPALGSADALVWSQSVDRVVVSTLLGSSDMRATQQVCQRLAMVGARVLGAVVCNVPIRNGFSSCMSSSYRSYSSSRSSDRSGDIFYLPAMQSDEEKKHEA